MTATYVAIRFPSYASVFHMLFDRATLGIKETDAYCELSDRVQASTREALNEMNVTIIE